MVKKDLYMFTSHLRLIVLNGMHTHASNYMCSIVSSYESFLGKLDLLRIIREPTNMVTWFVISIGRSMITLRSSQNLLALSYVYNKKTSRVNVFT